MPVRKSLQLDLGTGGVVTNATVFSSSRDDDVTIPTSSTGPFTGAYQILSICDGGYTVLRMPQLTSIIDLDDDNPYEDTGMGATGWDRVVLRVRVYFTSLTGVCGLDIYIGSKHYRAGTTSPVHEDLTYWFDWNSMSSSYKAVMLIRTGSDVMFICGRRFLDEDDVQNVDVYVIHPSEIDHLGSTPVYADNMSRFGSLDGLIAAYIPMSNTMNQVLTANFQAAVERFRAEASKWFVSR